MRCARELLADGTSVKETAALLGYQNQHHFSFAFKKKHGYAPSRHWKKVEEEKRKAESRKQNAERQNSATSKLRL